jgi:hypothetical protein
MCEGLARFEHALKTKCYDKQRFKNRPDRQKDRQTDRKTDRKTCILFAPFVVKALIRNAGGQFQGATEQSAQHLIVVVCGVGVGRVRF